MEAIRFVRFVLTAAVLAVGSLPVTATERIYTQNGDTAGFTYFPIGNWSTGNRSFEPGDDVIYRVADNMVDYAHFVAVTNAHTTFGTLSTTNLDVTLEFANWRTRTGSISLSDLSGWAGTLWFFRPDVVNFTQSTTVSRLRASGRPRLMAPADGKVVVSNLVGRGMVKTESAGGELELVRTSGDLAGVHFYNGDLTLHGDTDEGAGVDVSAVLSRAMIHLDAQNASSLTLENGKVKVWSDPVGGGQAVQMTATGGKPYQSYIDIPLPAYVTDYNGSGKPVVDFGPYKSTNETDFATSGAASLRFRKNGGELRDNVSHVFIVFADNDEWCRGTPFNDSYNHIFKRASYANPAVRNFDQTRLSKTGSFAEYDTSARTGRDAAYNGYPVQSMFQFGGRQLKIAELDYRRTDNSVPKNEKRVGALARHSFEWWGGVVIGEIVIFSDEGGRKVSLSAAERTAINDYLRRKWLPAEEQPKIALNELHYASPGAIKVPEGGTARVRHCVATRENLSKDGPGTLLVGDLTRTNAVVDVKDGAFGFAHRSAVSSAAPATGARHHFDADAAADSIVSETIDGVQRVVRWNDEDADHTPAMPVTDIKQKKTSSGASIVLDKPWVVENMLGGRRGIALGLGKDLGKITAGDYRNSTAFVYGKVRQTGNEAGHDGDFREGFAVVRFNTETIYYVFGTDCSAQNMHNMGNDAAWAHPDALGASVSWNGVPYDLEAGLASHLNEFGVLRFSCGDVQPVNAIGLDRYAPGSIGGLDICEYITYDRILTDRERIDTEAYLMKKWLGKDHPLKAEPKLAAVKFAAGKPAKLVAESDATVGSVDAPQGDLTKVGEGRLVAGLRREQLTGDLRVAAGRLEIADVTLADTLKKAIFHVDASDASTIVTNEAGEVTRWNDVRGADVFWAENWSDWPGAKPTVAKADCNGMDVIDFGVGNFANGDGIGWSKPEAKAACAAVTTGSGLKWSQRVQLVEGYQIFKLTGDANKPPVVGSTSDCNFHPDDTYIFNRNGNNTHYDVKNNSLMLVDDIAYNPLGGDESKWATYKPKESYRMYGFAVTNKTQAAYPWGASFAYERHQRAGGMRLAEGVFFSQALTADERQSVIDYLRHKWQVGVTGNVLAPASVEVAKGASLSTGDLSLAARSYSFELGLDGVVGNPLTVGGELILGDGTTIALHAPDGFALPEGAAEATFSLITANSVRYGANLVFDADEALTRNYDVSLDRNPDSVGVTFRRRGLVILIR